MPLHTFFWVEATSGGLRVTAMKADWLKDFLHAHPDALRHEDVGDGVLLTAAPAELQAFILAQAKTSQAWGDPAELHRVQPVTRPAP